jgi:hypothetical protein
MFSADDLRRVRPPVVLLVDYPGLGPLSHAILFERMDGDFAQLIDPLTGRIKLSLSALSEQWHGHAICVDR